MLQKMRGFAQSWVASIFLGLLALSFGVWGIADIFRGDVDTSVATVGGIKIEQADFQREYSTELKNESTRAGTPLTPSEARAMGLPQDVLQRMISRTAIDLVVQKLGLTATDSDVASQIRELPAFEGPNGDFDHQRFLQIITASGFTEQSFIAAVRADTARTQLLTATSDGLQVPNGYAKAIFDYLNEARAVSYVTVAPSAIGAVTPPNDSELEAFIKAHPQNFSTPAYRELTYAEISPESLAPGITVTQQQLHSEYELNLNKYQVPEKRTVEQITFPDEKSAAAAAERLGKGFSFGDLAAARGLKSSDIDLGSVSEKDLGGTRGKAAFSLKPGQVSQPVKGTFGYVLLKVTAITPAIHKSFDEVKAELLAQARQQLANEKVGDIINKFEDAQASGDTLEEAAKAAGMQLVHIKAVDSQGLTPDGSKAALPASPQFLTQAFRAEVGVVGDPFQTSDGSAYVIKVSGIEPPKLKPLAQVRKTALHDWTLVKTDADLLAKVTSLTATANHDGSLGPIAKALKVTVAHSPGLQRGQASALFPESLLNAIFAAPPGSAVMGKAADGKSFIIARITGVAHPPPFVQKMPQYAEFKNQLGQQIGADIPSLFAQAAREHAGVTINQQNLKTVMGTGS
ncbi:MAG: SurA N-terminal domain-containing protein [Rhizomicrobium sp.]